MDSRQGVSQDVVRTLDVPDFDRILLEKKEPSKKALVSVSHSMEEH